MKNMWNKIHINKAYPHKIVMLCFSLLFVVMGVFAQPTNTRRVSGIVTDNTKEPLIGVSVAIKGGSTGTITDIDGRYSIDVTDEKVILTFSFIGLETQEIRVGNQSVINVLLKDNALNLDELVVVGYGTQRRKDLTGAVASISGDKLKDIPVTSAAQAIVGRLPGVQITQTDGSPDAEMKIRVRGGGSITQDNSPLYVVDGFPVDDISNISPSDIESIDVLKDAATTAIYGARGANGVLVITTRQGYEGKATVKYNMYYGVKKVTKFLDVLNPYEFVFWQWEAQRTSSASYNGGNYGVFGDMDLYKEMSGTNFQKEVFGRTGTTLYNNVSITGGSKAVKYNLSLTRNDDKDIMIGTNFYQTNLTSNTSYTVNDKLSFNMNIRLSDYDLKGAGTGSLSTVIQYRPVKGLSDFIDEGAVDMEDETDLASLIDPISQSKDDYRHRKRQTFNYNASMTLKLIKDLSYRLDLGYQYQKNTQERFWGMNTSTALAAGRMPLATIQNTNGTSYRIANSLTYDKKKIRDYHNFTAMVAQEISVNKSQSILSSARYFPQHVTKENALSMMQLGKADPIVTSDPPGSKVASFFGRLNYDYDGRYLAAFTFRADGSSKFAPENRWGYFPAGSAAWRISEESFMSSTSEWLSNLKFRLGYGQTGNNRISDDTWRRVLYTNADNLFLEGEDTPTSYLKLNSTLYNVDLKWETTITRNLGLDFGFFEQRLSGNVELYKNTTKDLLVQTNIPSHTGSLRQWQNIGQTSNRGVEFMLEAVIVKKKDFDLSASFNIAFNKNRIDKLGNTKSWTINSNWVSDADAPKEDYLIEEGGKVGLMYGYVTEGYYSFDDFTYVPDAATSSGKYVLNEDVPNNSNLITPRLFRPGALKFKNLNPEEDNVINAKDKTVIGDANPLHTGGFSINSRYKGIDLSVFFNWVYGNDIYNANKLNFTNLRGGKYNRNMLDIMNSENRFTYCDKTTGEVVDDPTLLMEMNKDATLWSAGNSTVNLHSWAIEDGSFLRLNNVTIGYSFPRKWLSKIKVEQFRIYATGHNLWVWTKYSGYDPEVDAVRSTPLSPGIDYGSYPRSRSFNFGLNLTF